MNKEAQTWLGVIVIIVIALGIVLFANQDLREQWFDGKALRVVKYIDEPGTPPPSGGTPSGGSPTPPPSSCSTLDQDHDGQSPCNGDCNDGNPSIFRGATEYCGNSVDEDCSGVAEKCNVSSGLETTKEHYDQNEEVELT